MNWIQANFLLTGCFSFGGVRVVGGSHGEESIARDSALYVQLLRENELVLEDFPSEVYDASGP